MDKVDCVESSMLRPLVAREYDFMYVFLRPPAQDAYNVSQRKIVTKKAPDVHAAQIEDMHRDLVKHRA